MKKVVKWSLVAGILAALASAVIYFLKSTTGCQLQEEEDIPSV